MPYIGKRIIILTFRKTNNNLLLLEYFPVAWMSVFYLAFISQHFLFNAVSLFLCHIPPWKLISAIVPTRIRAESLGGGRDKPETGGDLEFDVAMLRAVVAEWETLHNGGTDTGVDLTDLQQLLSISGELDRSSGSLAAVQTWQAAASLRSRPDRKQPSFIICFIPDW